MRKLRFYGRLAATNLLRNRASYFPYLLTSVGCTLMLYIVFFIASNEGLSAMRGGRAMGQILGFGAVVVAIFTAVLLFYTNRFLIKRRAGEFGLYNILGMQKKHLAVLMLFETFDILLITAGLGLGLGILLSRLAMLILLRLAGIGGQFSFGVSLFSVGITLVLVASILLLSLLFNLLLIGKTRPIELLHAESLGEREPKTKLISALLGIVFLISGYTIALTTKDPIDAIGNFFVAVLLVIAGTYLIFTAASIVLLKALRKNKRYYYKTGHFISVSSMLHRMRANAVGLANICILSTMALITLSSTLCLHLGAVKSVEADHPYDLETRVSADSVSGLRGEILGRVRRQISESGCTVREEYSGIYLSFAAIHHESDRLDVGYVGDIPVSPSERRMLVFYTVDDYNRMSGQSVTLGDGELLVGTIVGDFDADFPEGSVELFGKQYHSVGKVDSGVYLPNLYYRYTVPVYLIIVDGEETLDRIDEGQQAVYRENASERCLWMAFNLEGSPEQKLESGSAVRQEWDRIYELFDSDTAFSTVVSNKQEEIEDTRSFYGGFLFIGIILGGLFLMATVMIIYYKQIAEGYEDRRRYAIMKKVGLDRREIRKAIFSQTILFFFLPLLTAVLHVSVAFPIVSKLLGLFQFGSSSLAVSSLFFACTAGCVLVFTVVYVQVYLVTARSYNRIVNSN